MGLTGTPVGQHSFDEGRSVLAKSWAGPDSHTEGSKFRPDSASKATAGRDYPRPWLSGSKPAKGIEAMDRDNTRPPPRKAHTYNDNEKPPWNAKTAVPSHDFDEWFNMQHRAPRTADEDLRDYQGSSWGRNGEIVSFAHYKYL
ncbi:uncharacterized protein LOC110048412 [Orbicella faveolata]|uniref:uncharacterized protein LOC110048412 n=1 Tax=Orbicella faveolata TaxID=48498 RepID=UPI0009E4D09B|nr:uncharacterized protein LOC110048412 [Orbicella faveolata]